MSGRYVYVLQYNVMITGSGQDSLHFVTVYIDDIVISFRSSVTTLWSYDPGFMNTLSRIC